MTLVTSSVRQLVVTQGFLYHILSDWVPLALRVGSFEKDGTHCGEAGGVWKNPVHRNPQTLLYMQLVWALFPKLIIPRESTVDFSAVPWVALGGKKARSPVLPNTPCIFFPFAGCVMQQAV